MSDIALLRLVLSRELETINEYEQFARDAEADEMKAFFRHLAKEEKEHVSEAMALINAHDPEQAAEWAEVNISTDHFANGKTKPDLDEAATPVAQPSPNTPTADEAKGLVVEPAGLAAAGLTYTVGSLKRRE